MDAIDDIDRQELVTAVIDKFESIAEFQVGRCLAESRGYAVL